MVSQIKLKNKKDKKLLFKKGKFPDLYNSKNLSKVTEKVNEMTNI